MFAKFFKLEVDPETGNILEHKMKNNRALFLGGEFVLKNGKNGCND